MKLRKVLSAVAAAAVIIAILAYIFFLAFLYSASSISVVALCNLSTSSFKDKIVVDKATICSFMQFTVSLAFIIWIWSYQCTEVSL